MTGKSAKKSWKLSFEKKPDKKLRKYEKKAPKRAAQIRKKIDEILVNPYRYKPLRGDLHGYYRVHVNSSFVILYRIDEEKRVVVVVALEHHDAAYE